MELYWSYLRAWTRVVATTNAPVPLLNGSIYLRLLTASDGVT